MVKRGFENLSFMQKVQLYLIVPMFFWLLLFMIVNFFISTDMKINQQQNSKITIEKNKIRKTVPSRVVRFIEEKIELYTVSLQTIHIKKSLIYLGASGSLENGLAFLKKLQTHLDIVSYRIVNEKNYVLINIVIDSEYFFNNGFLHKEFLFSKKTIKQVSKNIKIDAIISKEVLLDGIWYQEGSEYQKDYRVISIGKRFIELKNINTNKRFKVNLQDESL